jgi:hypothetical protein
LLFWCTGTDPKQDADGRFDLSAATAAAPKYLVETLNLMLSTNPAARPSIEQLMLYDPMMASREDPTDVFCNIVRQGVESASSIMGVPLINNVFTPKFCALIASLSRFTFLLYSLLCFSACSRLRWSSCESRAVP